MELHFVKSDLKFSPRKMFVSLEKQKSLKPKFIRNLKFLDTVYCL